MLKKALHITLSVFLAALLMFGGTAKEFIHLFADHHDTEHCTGHTEGLSFESEHHHCSFLGFSLPAYNNDIAVPRILPVIEEHVSHYMLFDYQLVQRYIIKASLRGPPSFLA